MRRVLLLSGVLLLSVAIPAALAVDSTTTIANVAPLVASAELSGLTDGALSPTAGTTTSSTVTITVTDDNGYQDIQYVNVTVKKPDGTTHIASSPATFSSGSLTSATYTYTFTMNFHDAPALLLDLYAIDVYAKDSAGAETTSSAISTFNYNELAALSTGASFSLGSSLTPGTTTSAQALSITNAGNVQLDVQLSGTDLSHATEAASIAVGNAKWNYTSDMATGTALSGSAATATAFDLARGASSTGSLYLALTVPSGEDQWVPAGTYSGTLTVGAIKG